MAQKKLKAKAQLPKNVKAKKNVTKGSPITKRANRPVQPKKKEEDRKLKQVITNTVNKAVEEEIRSRASDNTQKLSKAQEVTAEYNKKKNKQGSST